MILHLKKVYYLFYFSVTFRLYMYNFLTFKEFWIQVVKFYPQFISRPENELYRRIHGMDALKNKFYNELKDKIDDTQNCVTKGKPGYESKTSISNKKCYCPSKTSKECSKVTGAVGKVVGNITNTVGKSTDNVKETTNILTHEYKKPIKKVKDILLDCDSADDFDGKSYKLAFLSKLPVYIFWIIVTVILCMLGFILYGRIFDVPNFLKPYVYPKLKTMRVKGKLVPVFDKNILTVLFSK